MRVVWSERAWSDLEQIADYIAKDSRAYAASFVRQVKAKARSLRRFPEAGAIVPEFNDPAIRETFIKGYRLIYQVSANEAQLLALIHGARDLERALPRPGN